MILKNCLAFLHIVALLEAMEGPQDLEMLEPLPYHPISRRDEGFHAYNFISFPSNQRASYESFVSTSWFDGKLIVVQKGCDHPFCLLVSLDDLPLYELDFRQFSKSEKHQLGDVFLREPGHKFVSKHGRACNGSAWRRSWHSKFWKNGSITIN